MSLNNWKKVENEAGYPLFVDDATGKQQYDHPEFVKIVKSTEGFDGIKYTAYRTAFKTFALQTHLKVPPLRLCSGVFARHQLSLSESSLSLDTAELEAVLGDIYFAAEKDGHFTGDVDLVVDLLINLLLNVFDKERKEPVRVLAVKTLLICLSEESIFDKWASLANCCADHNGCVSPRRLASLLTYVTAFSQFLDSLGDTVQGDVDACFAQNAGMLGVTSRSVAEWGVLECKSTQWLNVGQRVVVSRQSASSGGACASCASQLVQVLIFQCTKCNDVYFCEKCYLYDKNLIAVSGHKKNHPIHEIVDGQPKPPVCLSFIKNMKRFFFCTKTKKRKTSKAKFRSDKETGTVKPRRKEKPAIFTSTVGKASGHKDSPALMLQDIITQLEAQNKILQDLASNVEDAAKSNDEDLKAKVDAHWSQISTQIDRLKILKDNLTASHINLPVETAANVKHPQAFDLFSPIPTIDKQSKINDNNANQPRVLSLDSGNFSVISKNASQNLLTVSGDALKPVAGHATSDSISTVSVNDISSWYNETNGQGSRAGPPPRPVPPDIAACEQKYAADNYRVETGTDKMRELNANLETVVDRLHQMLANNFAIDESCFDNTQLRETANEMEGLLGTLIRGVEQRATLNATRGLAQTARASNAQSNSVV